MSQYGLVTSWTLDSSTFIHAMIIERVALVVLLRSPVLLPEFVFRFELGTNAKERTRAEAESVVARKRIEVVNLTLADLDRIASLGAPRRIGLGEIACTVVAERCSGGVLCDDWRAKRWLEPRTSPQAWDSIEGILLQAAAGGHIGELDLVHFQEVLEENQYDCRCDLRMEHLQRQMSRSGRRSDDQGQ